MNGWDALFWGLATEFLGLGMVFVGLPVLGLALVLRLSSRPGLRRLARVLMVLNAIGLAALLVAVANGSVGRWRSDQKRRLDEARTLHLAASQVVAGLSLPPGSTVHLNEDGTVGNGSVPVPTRIAGLLLTGDFAIDAMGVSGTLTTPTELDGVPCKAGRVWWHEQDHIACALDRGYTFVGHDLAAGTSVEIYNVTPSLRRLWTGTLAHPELLLDVSWPAGTTLRGTSTSPEGLAHGAPPDELVQLCLLPGQNVQIPGATLHGAVTYEARGMERTVYPGCDGSMYGAGEDESRVGYAETGSGHYVRGRRSDAASPWQWTNDDPASVR